MKSLHFLLEALREKEISRFEDIEIRSVVSDSRKATTDSLFVAIRGQEADGHDFIPDALLRGARAVVGERHPTELASFLPHDVPYIQVPEGRLALAWLAAGMHDFPARRFCTIGVTGTDGKTTTTNLTYSILTAGGAAGGMISTVNARIGKEEYDTGLHTTTPDASEVQHYLSQMVQAGSTFAILEATSHGLAQHRVSACEFDIAVVTNITHEHLDYHGSREAYQQAKAMLFYDVSRSYRKAGIIKTAVLNRDDESYSYLAPIPVERRITYGLSAQANVSAEQIHCDNTGITFVALTPRGRFPVRSSLKGGYNVHNILAAIAAALSVDIPIEDIAAGISELKDIRGRMESIDLGQPFTVIVDFAHTPNALYQALMAARAMANGKIIVVFGCAGRRDREKRPLMGRIAAEHADLTILTAEDPRTEDLADINSHIVEGYSQVRRPDCDNLLLIDDRARAIQEAVEQAEPGDLVLIAGKGHERSLCFGREETPWSDQEAARTAIRRLVSRESYREGS